MNKRLCVLFCIILSFSLSFLSYAGEFNTLKGEFYKKDDGTYARDEWISIDKDGDGLYEWYYFNEYGFKVFGIPVKGYMLDEEGRWIVDGVIQFDLTKSFALQKSLANVNKNEVNLVPSNTNISANNTIISPDAAKKINENTSINSNNANSSNGASDVVISNGSSSGETKSILYNIIDSKDGATLYITKKVCGKSWVNVIGLNGNNSYITAKSGKHNSLSMEVGINNVKDTASYSLSIYVNGEYLESIEDFDSEPETLEFFFDPNSEIMIIYNVNAEDGTYLSSDNKNLYIRNAKFSNKQEK